MKIKKKSLMEASLADMVDKAEQQIDNTEVVNTDDEDDTEVARELSKALRVALRNKKTGGKNYTNILLVGEAGIGKTAITLDWAARHDINLVLMNTSTMDETDLTGVVARSAEGNSTIKLRSDVLKSLEEPRSVLFLDEYNRGRDTVRGTLLTLINDHLIDVETDYKKTASDRVGGKRELKNLLFTVAAINPADDDYNTKPLDTAEKSRFKRVDVIANKDESLAYLTKEITRQIKALDPEDPEDVESIQELEGQLKIATTLLTDSRFQFDNAKDKAEGRHKYGDDYEQLNPRALTNLLQGTDGTKEDFLRNWNAYCNIDKKPIVEIILAEYEDADDKANSVFKKRELSNSDKLNKFLNS